MATTQVRSPGWNRCVRAQIAGLGVGALGAAARWATGGLPLGPVPAGLLLAGVPGALLLAVRRPLTVLLGAAAAAVVSVKILTLPDGRLLRALTSGVSGAALGLQTVGVVVAVVAGSAALVIAVRRSWAARASTARASTTRASTTRASTTRAGGLPAGTRARIAQIAVLLVLAPVCAEYLAAYDDSTGRPAELLAGLVVFVPLYGCSALLIREVARRAGLGWPGILLLGSAFGLVQAGVVDQSLFSTDYRGIEGWAEGYRGTLIAPLGISAFNLLNFVGGHALFSIAAPIALVEAAAPAAADRPWLGRRGLALTAGLYLAGSALVLEDHLRTEVSHASTGQVVGSLAVVALLVTAAVRRRGRTRRPVSGRPAPSVPLVFAAALVLAAVNASVGETWTGVALAAATYAVAGVGVAVLSGRPGWRGQHVVVVAAAPLLCRGVLAFTYPPLIGEVAEVAKYGHNATMLAIVLGVAALAFWASRPHRDTDGLLTQGAGRTAG